MTQAEANTQLGSEDMRVVCPWDLNMEGTERYLLQICVSCRLASDTPMHAHHILTQPCFLHGASWGCRRVMAYSVEQL
ncbi:hypothetical protein LMH87_003644 [Akanthomyces muscarius]|uniref:Uncharacterized protein n=1 Tax=Akanthomyces muscarius TaxID=2231603 RepID=A0A9W8Q3T9_AKAMU|nr:hypothetical protein LMH87_003644 [Akanthomyces muscarius]KAJ4144774.1 hypothetical protein LMH87_003644 [Akanthomyces muscarius]